MKLGYPCINRSIGCTANRTFRLSHYSEENMREKVSNNLSCLSKILAYNVENGFLFFRISSDLIPFASHPICTFDWKKHFRAEFERIGKFIREHDVRISMHPDQFVLLNSPKEEVVESSVRELQWHADALSLMGLDDTAKIQIHVGGVYGNKQESLRRFEEEYERLSSSIKRRLVIENDDRHFGVRECVNLSEKVGIPVLFDAFHHECFNHGEGVRDALRITAQTWKERDGIPMVDYSSQEPGAKKGKHAEHIDTMHFSLFLKETCGIDIDIMLEIKDKEKSARKALAVLREHQKECEKTLRRERTEGETPLKRRN